MVVYNVFKGVFDVPIHFSPFLEIKSDKKFIFLIKHKLYTIGSCRFSQMHF